MPPDRRDVDASAQRIGAGPGDPREIGAASSASGRKAGRSDCGMAPARLSNAARCSARERRHRGNRAPGGRGVRAGDERLGRRARGGKHVARHVALSARAMQRDQPDQPGDRLRTAGMTGGFGSGRRGGSRRAPAPRAGSAQTPSRRNSLRARRDPASGRRRGRRCALRDSRRTVSWGGCDGRSLQAAPRRAGGRRLRRWRWRRATIAGGFRPAALRGCGRAPRRFRR